jgi:hypothetical protein
MVLVSGPVTISGAPDASGEMASIEAGTLPFYVDAREARVAIQGLRFFRRKAEGILVYRVSALVIASCKFEGVDVLNYGGGAISINTSGGIPSPDNPGSPENVSGTLLIVNNDIEGGGTAHDATLGVVIFSVGVPGSEVDIYISGNNIRNTTEPAINIRRIVGRAQVVRNVLTSSVEGPGGDIQVIRAVHLGSYLIAHNSIDRRWANPHAQGIGVFSPDAEWPIERAIIVDNDVTMSPPEATVFGALSGAITVKGFARGHVVVNNRIRGRARAALAVNFYPRYSGFAADTAFVLNRFDDFEPSIADVFVDKGVTNTLVVGPGTVEDHGEGTIIVPLK